MDTVTEMGDQFRRLKALHAEGSPAKMKLRVAVLHAWGRLRSWTLSGHFHETDGNVLIHLNEALSGLPVEVSFLSFEDVLSGGLNGVDVLINAGRAGDAWSGGDAWRNPALLAEVTRFVQEGGALLGVNEPTAAPDGDTCLRLAQLFGLDVDDGRYACHGAWSFETGKAPVPLWPEALPVKPGARLISGDSQVWAAKDGVPQATCRKCGKGKAVWLSGFAWSPEASGMLLRLLSWMAGQTGENVARTDSLSSEAAWFPASKTLVVLNNGDDPLETEVTWPGGKAVLKLAGREMRFLEG